MVIRFCLKALHTIWIRPSTLFHWPSIIHMTTVVAQVIDILCIKCQEWRSPSHIWVSIFSVLQLDIEIVLTVWYTLLFIFTCNTMLLSGIIFSGVRNDRSLVFYVIFSRSLFFLLSFFFWLLCCLSFDLPFLIAPMVSSNLPLKSTNLVVDVNKVNNITTEKRRW